ncbi:MAG: hypothetical protein ACYC25_11350 [Paludibacter sp.]
MRNFRFVKFGLLMILVLSVMASCNMDEVSNTGKVSVSFYNHPNDLDVEVYSIDNTQIPICRIQLDSKWQAVKDLNIGNYSIKINSNTSFSVVGFQVSPNKTTTIVWGADNVGKVQ